MKNLEYLLLQREKLGLEIKSLQKKRKVLNNRISQARHYKKTKENNTN